MEVHLQLITFQSQIKGDICKSHFLAIKYIVFVYLEWCRKLEFILSWCCGDFCGDVSVQFFFLFDLIWTTNITLFAMEWTYQVRSSYN